MRKIIGIMVILSCVSVLMGCTGKTIEASLDKEFTLTIGQTASISSENLKIKFLDVTADSRCPSDVQCVWAGEVKVLLNIADKDSSQKIEMVQPSLTGHKVGA